MKPRNRFVAALAASLVIGVGPARAQRAAEVAEKVKAIGPIINPPATAAIYASRVVEGEPYAGVTVTRDLRYGPADRHLLDVFQPADAGARPRPVLICDALANFVRRALAASGGWTP